MPQKWESCSAEFTNVFYAIDPLWYLGQTFKVLAVPHSVTSVKMYGLRLGDAGLVTVGIKPVLMIPDPYEPSVIGVPTAGYLTSATFDPTTIPENVRTLIEIPLPEVALSSGTIYAIATESPTAVIPTDYLAWGAIENSFAMYSDGLPWMYDVAALEWFVLAFDYDFWFEIIGNSVQSTTSTSTQSSIVVTDSVGARVGTVRHTTSLTPWIA